MLFWYLSLVERRKLKRACANAQTRQSFRCSHMQSMDVDEDSNQNLDIKFRWIRQHGRLKESVVHMR